MNQKYIVDGAIFDTILRTAIKQFHEDAQICGNSGNRRTMAQFLHQATIAEELLDNLDDNNRVIICADYDNKVRGIAKIEELAALQKHHNKCAHCSELQANHVDEVKCPFSSTLFLPEKKT